MGYRTCYYRCFTVGYSSRAMVDAYKRSRDYMDAAISIVKPGITTADIVKLWPKAEEFGFATAPLVTLAFQHPSGDRYIALGGRVTIGELVEEELLLALPIVPLHAEAGDCAVSEELPALKVEAPEQTTQKPFAQLDKLLKR